MFRNSNKEVINRLARRSLKKNRSRNLFAILSIILTSILFTVNLTLALSFVKSRNLENLRQHGTSAHGLIGNVDNNQMEKIKKDPLVEKVGTYIPAVGAILNDDIKDASIGLAYYDDNALSMKVYDDLVGNMPKEKNEVAMPTWILDKLNLKHELNQKIRLKYITSDKKSLDEQKEEDFILTGYYTEYTNIISGNKGVGIVSKDFCDDIDVNCIAYIKLNDKENIKSKLKEIANDAGIYDDNFIEENPIYKGESENDILSLVPYILMVLIIVSCGYLIIYNIFYISIAKDIRFYGFLKTVGATPRQIKKIILKQAFILSGYGIPIGIIIGYAISFIVVPMLLKNSNISKIDMSFNPAIFIMTIIFELFTIMIACKKPGKFASKLSPMEALKYVAVDKKKKAKKSTNGGKIHKMAWANVFRDKKRAMVVLLSLTLGLTCFLTAYTLSEAMDVDAYIDKYVKEDFKMSNKEFKESRETYKGADYIDKKMYSKIESIDEVKDLNRIKMVQSSELPYQEILKENAIAAFKNTPNYKTSNENIIPDDIKVEANIFGVTENLFDNLDNNLIREGEIDKEKLNSGEYAVLTYVYDNTIKVGDKINIGSSSNPIFVEVMAILNDEADKYYSFHNLAPNIYIGEDKLVSIYPDAKTLTVSFNVKEGTDKSVYSKLKDIADEGNVSIEAKFLKREVFKETNQTIYITLVGISIVLAFIGVLNFINTMLTSIISRKVEFAMLQSIGMTKKQLKRMLTMEGLTYGVLSIILVAIIGNVISYYAYVIFKQEVDYAVYHFQGTALLIALLAIGIISMTLPRILFKFSSKQSIIENLREI